MCRNITCLIIVSITFHRMNSFTILIVMWCRFTNYRSCIIDIINKIGIEFLENKQKNFSHLFFSLDFHISMHDRWSQFRDNRNNQKHSHEKNENRVIYPLAYETLLQKVSIEKLTSFLEYEFRESKTISSTENEVHGKKLC